ncbi:Kinase Suppressor Of Ras 1, partial [Manis pentadactyla]
HSLPGTVWALLDFQPQAAREAKLVRYICKQRQYKLSVAPGERTAELNSYPRFTDWLYTFNVRPEVVQPTYQLTSITERAPFSLLEVVKGSGRRWLAGISPGRERWVLQSRHCRAQPHASGSLDKLLLEAVFELKMQAGLEKSIGKLICACIKLWIK